MRRRECLAAVGSLAASAGCLGSLPAQSRPATTRTPPESTTAPPLAGTPCPSTLSGVGPRPAKVHCYRAADAGDIAMRPSTTSLSLPSDAASFTLVNRRDAVFHTSFYAWNLHKYHDGEWFHVAPGGARTIGHTLQPGESHAWHLVVDNTDLGRSVQSGAGKRDLTVEGLGGGVYAFSAAGRFREQGPVVAYAARVAAHGDPLALTATAAVTSAVRDGDTVTVTVDPDRDGYRAVLVATRVDSPPEQTRRVITEQVIRQPPLRNALAYATPDVDRVRVETVTPAQPPFAFLPDPPVSLRYRGDAFRLEVEALGE